MQFPEHTLESYKAAAIQGAGIIECDVTFTMDRELICRHSQCVSRTLKGMANCCVETSLVDRDGLLISLLSL